jgi:hypothetical protein
LDPVPHWHFVTYGLSELYTKESDDPETSGYGLELTFRLRCDPDEVDPPIWAVNFLQDLARYVFESGNAFDDGHWMTANGPIAAETETLLCSMAFAYDPELPAIDTPNGRLSFIQVIGLTADEERAAKHWKTRKLLDVLLPRMPLWTTDPTRPSLLDDNRIRAQVDHGKQRDGSSSGGIFADVDWIVQRRLLRSPLTHISIGAIAVEDLLTLLSLRLPFGRDLEVVDSEKSLQFLPATANSVTEEGGALIIRLTDESVHEFCRTLKTQEGTYVLGGLDGVRWRVQKSTIKDSAGKVTPPATPAT